MSVQSVPTFRAAHLSPYLKVFAEKNIPFDRTFHKFRLPTTLGDDPETRLPLGPAIKFLSYMERSEGIRDLGIQASKHINVKLLSHANRQSISCAPTLGDALDAFTRNVSLESSVVEAWIVIEGNRIKLCENHRVSLDDDELRLMKLHFMLLFRAIVRSFAGPSWSPNVLALRSRIPLSPYPGDSLPGTRILFGQDISWIDLPKDMLSLRQGGGISKLNSSVYADHAEPSAAFTDDFPTSLKRVLKAYLPDGYPSIELAAGITGTSVRTLQRNLARSRLTYSKLVEIARFEAASEMLQEPGAKIIDVAYAVGYEDPSHFSRAFRRMTGTSPRGFRMSGAA
jgi:AraC-like DNA-binding protein